MLKNQNMIYFAPEPWSGLWRNRQQLMSIFARYNQVLFVEPPLHFKPTVRQLRQKKRHQGQTLPPLRQISDKLYVFRYPVWAPISGDSLLGSLTQTLRQRSLAQTMNRLGFEQPIVWFSRPTMVRFFQDVPQAKLRLYHVVDEYTAYTNHTDRSRRNTAAKEAEMLAQVDMVIVVSQKLYESKSPCHAHTYLVSNGVNYQAYTTALAEENIPAAIHSIPMPRLGYIGLIGDKLDFQMLLETAERHPDWSFIFLGKDQVSKKKAVWQKVQALPNVYVLPAVDVSEVPYYVKTFQVGLMPYEQNRHADHISPLKLYDYLAAGIPVVSNDIPAARQFESFVHIADDPHSWDQAIQKALDDHSEGRVQARRDVAANHTWEARAETLSSLIEARLMAKSSSNQQDNLVLSEVGSSGSSKTHSELPYS